MTAVPTTPPRRSVQGLTGLEWVVCEAARCSSRSDAQSQVVAVRQGAKAEAWLRVACPVTPSALGEGEGEEMASHLPHRPNHLHQTELHERHSIITYSLVDPSLQFLVVVE